MSEAGVARRLTTILAADVVGYSRPMAADKAGMLAQLNVLRKELIDVNGGANLGHEGGEKLIERAN